jgi:soluble lytic murein transglycosylase-like protein
VNLVTALCMAVASLGVSKSEKRTACTYMPYIVQQSAKHSIDPSLIVSVMFVESSFGKKAVSHAGACGLMQLIPKWNPVKIRGKKHTYTCEELFHPRRNIKLGVRALKRWLNMPGIEGDMNRALCAYNAGNRCRFHKRIPDASKTKYTKAVRKAQKKIHAAMDHKPFGRNEIIHCTVDVCPGSNCPCVHGEENKLYLNNE